MNARLKRILSDQRGQTLLIMTFLILLVLGALALREMTVNSFIRTVSQNSMEDKMARQMSDSGSQEAIDMVRRLDDRLDRNDDGAVDSTDGEFISNPREIVAVQDGNPGSWYNFKVRGTYANERLIYFQFDEGGNAYDTLQVEVLEDSGLNPVPIVSFSVRYLDVPPSERPYRRTEQVSLYPGDNEYVIRARLTGTVPTPVLWFRVRNADDPRPFTAFSPGEAQDRSITWISPDDTGGNDGHEKFQAITDVVDGLETVGKRAFEKDVYEIEASGLAGDQRHNMILHVKRENLLKYAFFSNHDLLFLPGATINGFVYAYHDIILNNGDPPKPTIFRRPARVVTGMVKDSVCGDHNLASPLPNGGVGGLPDCQGEFRRGVSWGGDQILLPRARDFDASALLANAGEPKGGWYVEDPGTTLILDLSLFDFTASPPVYDSAGISSVYGGPGRHDLPSRFNGLVMAEGDVRIRGGKLQGKGLTIISRQNMIIENSVLTGTTPEGNPVNVGLVAGAGYVKIDTTAPRILHIHAALFAAGASESSTYDPNDAGGTWIAEIDGSNPRNSHPPVLSTTNPGTDRADTDTAIGGCDVDGTVLANGIYGCGQNPALIEVGAYDVDGDGVIEGPFNDPNDPAYVTKDGFGWDETALAHDDDPDNPDHPFFLLIRGPIIIQNTGSAGTWSWLGNATPPTGWGGTEKTTRTYQYDPDITRYPPPNFPIPLNATRALTYAESMEDEMLIPQPTPTPTP